MIKDEKISLKLSNVFNKLLKTELSTEPVQLTDMQNLLLVTERMFQKSFNNTVWQYRNEYSDLYTLLEPLTNTSIESFGIETGISRCVDMVVGNAVMREFINRTHTSFKLSISLEDEHYNKILKEITKSIVANKLEDDQHSLMPTVLSERMYSRDELYQIFVSNSWLVTVVFIVLWAQIYTPNELIFLSRGEE